MKKISLIIIVISLYLTFPIISRAQIGEIKDLASGAGDLLSGCSTSDIDAGCYALSCCWDGGFFILEFIIDHHEEILNMRYLDPTVLSFEIEPQLAYALHFGADQTYKYVNYLPQVRANLGVISTDFRFNMLTEYTNGFPDAFQSWEILLLLNIVPDKKFRISVGSGLYVETFTQSNYNENYLGLKFMMPNEKDFLDMDTRVVCDYNRGLFPFIEGGIRYSSRFIDFEHIYGYITFGAMYQNYYSSHDIWAAKGGLSFNFH